MAGLRLQQGVALNLRDPAGMAWLRRLLSTAQVMVESFRPRHARSHGPGLERAPPGQPGAGDRARIGLGPERPYSELPGFGSLIEGFSVLLHKHHQADGAVLVNLAKDMVWPERRFA